MMMNVADKYSKEHVKKRRSRCGQCGPCQVKEDCGKCKYCLNKQVLKQSCMYRKCLYLRCKPAHESRMSLDSSFSEGELSKSSNSDYGVSSPTSTMPQSPMFGAPLWSSPTGNYMSTQSMPPYVPIAESVPANDMAVAAVDPVFPAPHESSASSEMPVNNWSSSASEVKIKTEMVENSYASASSQHQQQPHQQAPSYEQIKMQEFLHSKPIPSPHPVVYSSQHGMHPHHMEQRPNHMMSQHPNHMPGLLPMNGLQPHMLHSPGSWPMPMCSEHSFPMGYPRTSVPQIGGPLLAGLGPPPSPSIVPTMEVFNIRQNAPMEMPPGVVHAPQQEECIISIDNTAIPAFVQTDGLNNVEITTVHNPSLGSNKDILSAAIEESGISDLAQEASMETQYGAIPCQNIYRHNNHANIKMALEAQQGIVLQQNLGAGGEIQINLPSNGITVENVTIDEEMGKYSSNSEMLMYPGDIFAHQVM